MNFLPSFSVLPLHLLYCFFIEMLLMIYKFVLAIVMLKSNSVEYRTQKTLTYTVCNFHFQQNSVKSKSFVPKQIRESKINSKVNIKYIELEDCCLLLCSLAAVCLSSPKSLTKFSRLPTNIAKRNHTVESTGELYIWFYSLNHMKLLYSQWHAYQLKTIPSFASACLLAFIHFIHLLGDISWCSVLKYVIHTLRVFPYYLPSFLSPSFCYFIIADRTNYLILSQAFCYAKLILYQKKCLTK